MTSLYKQLIYVTLILIMGVWGLNVIATKLIVSAFMPVTITTFRIFTASICVFIILALMKKVRLPSKREFRFILIGALFNVVAHHYFLSIGLKNTTASNGGLILGLGPLLTTVLAIMFLGSSITIARIVGILMGLGGVALIVLKDGSISSISFGDIFVFFAILSQAISLIFVSKIAKSLDPRLMTFYMLFIGSIILFFISLVIEPDGLHGLKDGSAGIWIIFFASALLATAIGHMVYNFAVAKIGAAEASIFTNLSPFFSLVGAAIFLDEIIAATQIIGFVLIISGVIIGSDSWKEILKKSRQKKKTHLSA